MRPRSQCRCTIRVAQELPALSGMIDADVSNMEQVQAAFAEAIELMGSVDVLINNAGISIRHDFLDITPDEWDQVLNVNLKGVFYVAQTAARHMMEKGSGVILNTASTAGYTGTRTTPITAPAREASSP